MQKIRRKPGPQVPAHLGPLTKHVVTLDEHTLRCARVLGKNLSDGLRKAVAAAYAAYQAAP